MNTLKAFNILLDLKKVFDNLNITFWLDGGTALGAWRENGFMSSDFDVDVGIYGEDDTKIPQIIQGLRDLDFKHFHLKEHPCGEGKQVSWVKDDIPGDIFVYYKRDNQRWRLMFDYDILGTVRFIPCVLPVEIFDNLEKIDFMDYGVELNIPPKEYLTLQYGDWKTDKTKEEFHWQTDYRNIQLQFVIYPKPEGKRKWLLTETIKGKEADGSFFKPMIKEGFKLFPLVVTKDRNIIDGNKRLQAYKELNIPMVECYVS